MWSGAAASVTASSAAPAKHAARHDSEGSAVSRLGSASVATSPSGLDEEGADGLEVAVDAL